MRRALAGWNSLLATVASGATLLFFISFSQVENAECRSVCRLSRGQAVRIISVSAEKMQLAELCRSTNHAGR